MKRTLTNLMAGTVFSLLSLAPSYAQDSLERISPKDDMFDEISLALPTFEVSENTDEERTALYQSIPDFPRTLTQDHAVYSTLYPDSDHYLIHIKQSHLPNIDELIERFDNGTEAEQDRISDQVNQIMDIQYEIVGIYQELRTHLGITDIYAEGFTQEMIPKLPSRDVINEASYEFFLEGQSLQDAFSTIQQYQPEFTFEAVLFLYDMGFAGIQPAEQAQEYTRAGDVFEQTRSEVDFSAIQTHIFENREDALLENITQSEHQFAVTVYGSMHSWQDNIEEWNANNPDNTISLIEITPDSLEMMPPLPENYSEHTYKPSE